MREAVIFGAGSVGRGFIGQLFSEAGFHVTFVDVSPVLVGELARAASYQHVTVSSTGSTRTTIGPVTALEAGDGDAVVKALVAADLAATAVGAAVLPAIAPTLARAVERRVAAGRPPLNVLLCENLHSAGDVMRGLVTAETRSCGPEDVADALGLVETSIGRMIPVPDPAAAGGDPTVIFAEPYKILPYDAAAVRGEPLAVPGLVCDPSVPFAFFGERKLYLHNLGHVLTAYLGEHAGVELVADAISLPSVRYLVRAAMVESALVLSLVHGRPMAELVEHVDDLIHRFGNHALADPVERVGRDPIRKTAPDDRLLGPYTAAVRRRLPSRFLSLAVATGGDALRRHEGWSDAEVTSRLDSGLSAAHPGEGERELLRAQLDALEAGLGVDEQIDIIDRTYEPSRVP